MSESDIGRRATMALRPAWAQQPDSLRDAALTAVGPVLEDNDYWLPLPVRQEIADAILRVVAASPQREADFRRVALDRIVYGDALRQRIVKTLREAAHDCDGNCGLSEDACVAKHPIQVTLLQGGDVACVEGGVEDIALIVATDLSGPKTAGALRPPHTCTCSCEACTYHRGPGEAAGGGACERHPQAPVIGGMCGGCTQYGTPLDAAVGQGGA